MYTNIWNEAWQFIEKTTTTKQKQKPLFSLKKLCIELWPISHIHIQFYCFKQYRGWQQFNIWAKNIAFITSESTVHQSYNYICKGSLILVWMSNLSKKHGLNLINMNILCIDNSEKFWYRISTIFPKKK